MKLLIYMCQNPCQDTDVPKEIIKENAGTFSDFIHPAINTTINKNE